MLSPECLSHLDDTLESVDPLIFNFIPQSLRGSVSNVAMYKVQNVDCERGLVSVPW